VELIKTALRLLTRAMRYRVPREQNLAVDLRRIPALPASSFLMRDIRMMTAQESPSLAPPHPSAYRTAFDRHCAWPHVFAGSRSPFPFNQSGSGSAHTPDGPINVSAAD
jgi:hypothetical protein